MMEGVDGGKEEAENIEQQKRYNQDEYLRGPQPVTSVP